MGKRFRAGRAGGIFLAATLASLLVGTRGAEETFNQLAGEYAAGVRPLLEQNCLGCHSTEKRMGELDLERFATLRQVRGDLPTWQKVLEMLASEQMPPEAAPQPSEEARSEAVRWVRRLLDAVALARAGDPGRVLLRRLSNAEYNYSVRDLTGVDLEPAREFPIDGAAGEGFTNTGESLVMSPALLQKYMDAARSISAHMVLLSDGIRFSPQTTSRNWTDEVLDRLRSFYRRFADEEGHPLSEPYLAATLRHRGNLVSGETTLQEVAREEGLRLSYLRLLWETLTDPHPSFFLDPVRARWLTSAPNNLPGLAEKIKESQERLWKLNTVGHRSQWQEPLDPFVAHQELKARISTRPGQEEATIYLRVRDAGDGARGDYLLWDRPRFEAPGQQPILLRDVDSLDRLLRRRLESTLKDTTRYLAAVAEQSAPGTGAALQELASKHGVEERTLENWALYLQEGGLPLSAKHYLSGQLEGIGRNPNLNGWGEDYGPRFLSNSSDRNVDLPGFIRAHWVACHPSATHFVGLAWQSPLAGTVRVRTRATDAQANCGNGVAWSLQHRRRGQLSILSEGTFDQAGYASIQDVEKLDVEEGDLIVLEIDSRDGDDQCDLTVVRLTITEQVEKGREWNLDEDVADDILVGNPHPDRLGHPQVWHFYQGPSGERVPAGLESPPEGSVLARWSEALADPARPGQLVGLAQEAQAILTGAPPKEDTPDRRLHDRMTALDGPLYRGVDLASMVDLQQVQDLERDAPDEERSGPDPSRFGHHPLGHPVGPESLVVQAPSLLEFQLPAQLLSGREFVVEGRLDSTSGGEGTVQLDVSTSKPAEVSAYDPDLPIVVLPGGPAQERLEVSSQDFRRVFPRIIAYTRIVPVDEIITIRLFFREDEHLRRLFLDRREREQLDRLWTELHYISQDALKVHRSFDMFLGFASQGGKEKLFEPMREPIRRRAEAFGQELLASEPSHLETVMDLASRAYRRPLSEKEKEELRSLYSQQRAREIPHDEALRTLVSGVLVSPHFLYKVEQPAPGEEAQPVSDLELATRLSYFLWSSLPDSELLETAAAGRLRDPSTLENQALRMLREDRIRGLAIEFAAQWIHVRSFARDIEKNERLFPGFDEGLRRSIQEECVRFFQHLFQEDGSVLEILDADYTFVNDTLARHYGIPGVDGSQWQRVDGVGSFDRGGILGFASVLATQSGVSRTSPILRGNFILESILGEHLPRPPPNVPELPADETATDGLTIRQLTEKHRSVPGCAVCHAKMDPFGFSLEGFDATGRRRDRDLAGRPVETAVELNSGDSFDGLSGLRDYLLGSRREQFLRNFSKKLLGYALGRAVTLSDEPLVDRMLDRLEKDDYRFSSLVQTIVASCQFRYRRGLEDR